MLLVCQAKGMRQAMSATPGMCKLVHLTQLINQTMFCTDVHAFGFY